MSREKYLSIFSPQMEAIVFIVLQKLFATHSVLKVGEYHSDIPPGISSHMTRLDQSCARENIEVTCESGTALPEMHFVI